MPNPRAIDIIDDYETNTWLIHHQVDGVSERASLLLPPFPTNSLNWILGHIVWRRSSALAVLGLPPLWDEDIAAAYQSDSDLLTSPARARSFSALLADLDQSQQALKTVLQGADDPMLDAVVENDRGAKPVIEHLRGFHWHETLHVGQLDILRAFVDFTNDTE
jgi:hypothetical protein